jgi:hypothetical protein
MGRTSASWPMGSSWNHGETKTIRVPIVLEQQIMDYARMLDSGEDLVQENVYKFLKIKRRQYSRAIAHDDEMTNSVRWEVFNEFRRWYKSDRSSKQRSTF